MAGQFSTQTDLVNEALGSLNALETGQVPNVEDVAYVTSKVDPVIRTLEALDICHIPDRNNIPSELLMPLASVLASYCLEKFSPSPDTYQRVMLAGIGIPPGSGAGAQMIKQILRGRPTYEPLRIHYF